MVSFAATITALSASLVIGANALNGIVAPDSVQAGYSFNVTFENADDSQYRVYLAARLSGSNGPTCYLQNSTTLSSPINISIPSDVGPSGDYYSIAISDLSTSQSATYSNMFNFTGGTGNYTAYENNLGGASFWSADDLPCSAYPCARDCAMASYPDDLTDQDAYDTMKECINDCSGVSPDESQTTPAQAPASSSTGSSASSTSSGAAAKPDVAILGAFGLAGVVAMLL
ncbi:hypothetical protein KC343_g2873 [Hortaea werneckii]|uniref:Uncharacterized protein n=1 Tax=Hortaea werneckii TaxID=91943 RepID=A0A3M7HFV2_HORWE|nr:hypothetical protein KC338_g5602 [Hortaea werneckii]KAI6871813.1 hypothetical protein KC323_g1781 [Hortaea werneckii]KAI7251108.1 hypothetical protein KC352_g12686 [Hortaea werneckii]KAI7358731.1 hypothetical protein KC320_g961 [Hortaea werneckii]KAI7570001.1 hypothetical protein KC317_g2846 [Hortaea werneckii]